MSYRVQSIDTSVEMEQLQTSLLRKFGASRRFAQMISLSNSTRRMSWHTLNRIRPTWSFKEKKLFFINLLYGQAVADTLAPLFEKQEETPLEANIAAAITALVEAFEALEIAYLIGGSVASSVLGFPRSTNDADLVADLSADKVKSLVALLEAEYYVSESAIHEAITRLSSFNVIHQNTATKVDVFILNDEAFNQTAFARRRTTEVENSQQTFVLCSPEDIILQKLVWYRLGGEVSEKQWLDVLGVAKVQAADLDRAYLREWAAKLDLTPLLDRALSEAGLD